MVADNNHMLVCVIFLSLCSGYVAQTHDHFKLVQEWPPSFCKINKCVRTVHPINFTIHGLWPDKMAGRFMMDCYQFNGAPPFMSIKDPKLVRRMDENWPDLTRPTTYATTIQTFWMKQWAKHGTCSWNFFPRQNLYFERALLLKDKFDLLKILQNNQINPGSDVEVGHVTSIIARATGGQPIVKCTTYPHPQTPKKKVVQLTEIIVCFDYNAVSVISCPRKNKRYDYGCTIPVVDFPA